MANKKKLKLQFPIMVEQAPNSEKWVIVIIETAREYIIDSLKEKKKQLQKLSTLPNININEISKNGYLLLVDVELSKTIIRTKIKLTAVHPLTKKVVKQKYVYDQYTAECFAIDFHMKYLGKNIYLDNILWYGFEPTDKNNRETQ